MEATKSEWTTHSNTCESCGRAFRLDAEAWRIAVEDAKRYGESTDPREIIKGFEECLECAFGEAVPGEHPDVRFRHALTGEIREGWKTREWPELDSVGVVLPEPIHGYREIVVHRSNLVTS